MIVVGADIFIFQERKHFVSMTLQSLNKPFGVFVFVVLFEELLKAMVESCLATIKDFQLGRIFSLRESEGIFEQAQQLFAKSLPLSGRIALIHLGQFGEQVVETPLLCQSPDLVIGAPEIADKDSLEQGSQDVFDHRGSPAFGDEVIAELLAGETPQPMGDSVKSPSGLISVQDSAGGDPLANVMINRFKKTGEVLPGLGQASGAYFESTNDGEDPDDIIDADPNQIMKPCAEHHKPQADHGVGQGICNRGEDDLFALRAPIAIDGMLCNLRFFNKRDIFGITLIVLNGFFERCLTIRALLKGVFFEMIHVFGSDAGNPFMAFLSSGPFSASPGTRL
jgi:hypothetical protein